MSARDEQFYLVPAMKIGIIGNMNNNGFALMRYWRDLGADAHLLLWRCDGAGHMAHFDTDADTWDPDRWAPFIHRLPFRNGPGDLVGPAEAVMPALQPLVAARSAWRLVTGTGRARSRPASPQLIRDEFGGFSALVGSGLSPAYASLAGIRLAVFFPYAIGVEFVGSPLWTNRPFSWMPHVRKMKLAVSELQSCGIRDSGAVINAELGLTNHTLRRLGVEPVCLPIPMVYNREPWPELDRASVVVTAAIRDMHNQELAILHVPRLNWVRPRWMSRSSWQDDNKNNDWFFRAVAQVTRLRPRLKVKVYVCQYGQSVDETVRLVCSLGIESNVYWLPTLNRRDLTLLLSACQVAAGEFIERRGCLWGGATWEALAAGRAVIQGFNFGIDEYAGSFGHQEPPMLKVTGKGQILEHLLRAADDPHSIIALGAAARQWFDRHNGIGLAKKWLDITAGVKVRE